VKRPSKKDIKAAIEKLKEQPAGSSTDASGVAPEVGKLTSKKNNMRIRKQGV
jgi:ribosomal protein S12